MGPRGRFGPSGAQWGRVRPSGLGGKTGPGSRFGVSGAEQGRLGLSGVGGVLDKLSKTIALATRIGKWGRVGPVWGEWGRVGPSRAG